MSGTPDRTLEEQCLLACSYGSLSLVFYTLQDHLLRQNTTHSKLSPPISITGQSAGDIFSVEITSSQMTPAYVKFT